MQTDKTSTVTSLTGQRTAGDWLLTFHAEDAGGWPYRTASAPWQLVVEGEAWHLWRCPAGEQWSGAPVLVIDEQEWQIWFLGELYGEDRLEQFMAQWFAGSHDGTRLNGHFLLLAWNRRSRQWNLWTDRFGTLHTYWAHDGRRTAIGTFFPAVAAAASQRRLDWIALTSFFSFSFFAEDRTHFEDVRLLRPASHYVFDNSGKLCHQERYWTWEYRPDEQRSYEETIDNFAGLLQQVMAERLKGGRIALPITGGLDTRSTVAALDTTETVSSLWPYSYGYSDDSIETEIARQVAEAGRLPIQTFTIRPYVFERLHSITASVEGFGDVTQCRQASVVDEVGRQADYLIAAHWGDVWLDDMGLVGTEGSGASEEAVLSHAQHKMEKKGRDWLLEHLCRPRLNGAEPDALARQIVEREMVAVKHISDPDFRVKAFKTEQWSWRGTVTGLRMFQRAAWPRLPFYDTRMADFFCTVPSTFVAGRQLQIDYLKRRAPELARVKWQVYNTSLYRTQHFNTWLLPKRALKKGWRLLTGKQVIQSNWEVQFLNEGGRQGLQQWLLEPGLRLHEFVAPASLSQLLDTFYADPWAENRGYTLAMLLTFSNWLEQYG